jgi:proline iminopeptidase
VLRPFGKLKEDQKMKNTCMFPGLLFAIGLAICLVIANLGQISLVQASTKKAIAAPTSSVAAEWYLPTEDKDVPFLYVYEIGKGEPVIVLHGGPGISHNYMTDIAKGLDNRFRFIFYDQRGAGFSHAYSKEAITMEKNVQDVEKLRKSLGIEKINLISHSAGTYLAMGYLQTYPQNVKNLVLLGATDPKNGSSKFFTAEEKAGFSLQAEEARRFNERPEVQAEIDKAGLNKANLTAKEEFLLKRIKSAAGTIYHVERWRQYRFFFVNRDAAQGARSGLNLVYDWSNILAAHPYPVTVINGEYDYQVGRKGSPIWKRVVTTEAKNVKLVLINKAGHNSWMDDPVAFRNGLWDALNRKK